MIDHYFKYTKKGLEIEFNWDDSVIPCKKVKIELGGEQVVLDRDEFATLMAVFADDQQMEDIMQTKKTKFVSIERMLKLKTDKDIKAGENIVFPYTYWIPETEYLRLKEDGEMIKLIKDDENNLIKQISQNEAAKNVKELWQTGKLKL